MELLTPSLLATKLERLQVRTLPISPLDARHLLRDCASGMDKLHEVGC